MQLATTRAARPDILEKRRRVGFRVPAAHAHAYLLLSVVVVVIVIVVVATSAVRGPREYQSIDFTLFPIVQVVFFPSFTTTLRRVAYLRPDPLASQSTLAESGRCQRSLDVTDVRHVVREWGLPFGNDRCGTLMNGTDTTL